jgi:hypothetical protein
VIYSDNSKYIGNIIFDTDIVDLEETYKLKQHGFGTMHYSNGNVYKGDWVHNKRHGTGIMYYIGGIYVKTQWENDVMVNNIRHIRYPDKSEFNGECDEQFRPHGHGMYTWTNGNYYSGLWVDGKRTGIGLCYNYIGRHAHQFLWYEDNIICCMSSYYD